MHNENPLRSGIKGRCCKEMYTSPTFSSTSEKYLLCPPCNILFTKQHHLPFLKYSDEMSNLLWTNHLARCQFSIVKTVSSTQENNPPQSPPIIRTHVTRQVSLAPVVTDSLPGTNYLPSHGNRKLENGNGQTFGSVLAGQAKIMMVLIHQTRFVNPVHDYSLDYLSALSSQFTIIRNIF